MSFRAGAILRVFTILVSAAWLGGCSSVPFNVTAMRFDPEPPRERSFQVASPTVVGASESVDPGVLAGYVNTALLNRGFTAATGGNPAGMVIDVLFEQGTPRIETRVGTENLYQWAPEQTVLTTKQTKSSTGLVFGEAVPKKVPAHTEVVGTRTVQYLVKVFPKRLRIVGRTRGDPAVEDSSRLLWSVEVRNDEEIQNLSRCVVQMVAAAMDDLGNDFSGHKTVSVSSGDERTKILRAPRSSSSTAGRAR